MEKDTCDVCGKTVGAQALYRRVGFTPGARTHKVCGACFKHKLPRDERLRFAKSAGAKKRATTEEPEDAWGPRPPDELRF